MFDIDKILSDKKQSKRFDETTMSDVFGKNMVSDIIGKATQKPLDNMGASIKKQTQWKQFTHKQRNRKRSQYKDSDGDRVPNPWDCQPFNPMRQDFTPFRDASKAEKMSAARRFGGKNLQGLKKLGAGRDREVYQLDDDKVLKVAKNPGGLTQNVSEEEIENWGLGEHYETGKDYTVMRKNRPLSKESKQKLAKVREQVDKVPYTNNRRAWSSKVKSQLSEGVLDEAGIGTDILNYEFEPNETFANRQWGEDEQGNLQLNDAGVLLSDEALRKHRVKDFSSDDWQAREWQDVKQQRRAFRDKGAYDENLKQQKEMSDTRDVEYTDPERAK